MPQLIFINPEFLDQTCQLPNGTFTVGRGKGNDIIIRADSVSQTHCELLVYGPEVIVREKGSRNGTFVDGVQIIAQSGVHHGDVLQFGKVKVRLALDADGNNQTTAISAMEDFRRIQENEKRPKIKEQEFPVIFTPAQKNPDLTATTIAPHPPSPSEPHITSESPPVRPTLSVGKGIDWKWIAAGVGVAVAIVYFVWK